MNGRSAMNMQRDFLLFVILAAAAASPAAAQTVTPAGAAEHGAVSIPDFSRVWNHPAFPWFEPPASGPGPITNLSRWAEQRPSGLAGSAALPASKVGISDYDRLVGDYKSPILQPWAAAVVKKFGEISLAGITYPNPSNQCWPFGMPFIYKQFLMEMIQQPDQIPMLYGGDHELRRVRLNGAHPSQLMPSWYGDSVGHYEGDTLVIDTVGIKTGPYTMVDQFGTPHTQALHVIERYRLIDYEAAKQALERGAKENASFVRNDSGVIVDLNSKAKHLQLQFTVEDEGAFTTSWSATVIYRPGMGAASPGEWPEAVCTENPHELSRQAV